MIITAICNNCHETVPCLESDMYEELVVMSDLNQILVTSWVCPSCKEVHNVQLDDDNSKGLFEKVKTMISRFRRKAVLGQRVSHSAHTELYALQQSLDEARSALNARYDGSIYQLGEQKFKLELRPPEAKLSGEKENNHA